MNLLTLTFVQEFCKIVKLKSFLEKSLQKLKESLSLCSAKASLHCRKALPHGRGY